MINREISLQCLIRSRVIRLLHQPTHPRIAWTQLRNTTLQSSSSDLSAFDGCQTADTSITHQRQYLDQTNHSRRPSCHTVSGGGIQCSRKPTTVTSHTNTQAALTTASLQNIYKTRGVCSNACSTFVHTSIAARETHSD